jgi:outer membrane protein TolC
LAACLLGIGLVAPPARAAGLGFDEAVALAAQSAPALRAAEAALGGAASARPAAATLPDPRLAIGIESLPVAGADRWRTTRDTATMQRLALMQEVPDRAKRDARALAADARIERERAALALGRLAVRRDAALAWLAVHFAEQRRALLADLLRENRLLHDTLPARIAADQAPAAELTLARQEALAIADRGDEAARDVQRARAELRRWVGPRGDEPLAGVAPLPQVDAEGVRAGLHRHAEIAPFEPMRAQAAAELAEARAEGRGDWSWEVAYGRRPRYDDMVSFQLRFDLPWQRTQRQQPLADAKQREVDRIDAERDDVLRRHAADVEWMLADLAAVETQLERVQGPARALAAERVDLALAAYRAGRGDLGAVLAARAAAVETRLRAIELDAQRSALRVRLTTLTAE